MISISLPLAQQVCEILTGRRVRRRAEAWTAEDCSLPWMKNSPNYLNARNAAKQNYAIDPTVSYGNSPVLERGIVRSRCSRQQRTG